MRSIGWRRTAGHDADRAEGENAARNIALLRPVQDTAVRRSANPAQIALASLMARSQLHSVSVVPVPGTKHPRRIEENAAATTDIELTPGDLAAPEPLAGQVCGAPGARPASSTSRQESPPKSHDDPAGRDLPAGTAVMLQDVAA